MGFFDLLGKANEKVNDYYGKQQEKIDRYERSMKYRSDSTLKSIAKDKSRPYFERAVAAREYKNRKNGDN